MSNKLCPMDSSHKVKPVYFSNKKEDFFHYCEQCKEDIGKMVVNKKQETLSGPCSVNKNRSLKKEGFSSWSKMMKINFLNKYPAFCNDEEFKTWSLEDQKEWFKNQMISDNNNEDHGGTLIENF